MAFVVGSCSGSLWIMAVRCAVGPLVIIPSLNCVGLSNKSFGLEFGSRD